MTIIKTNWLMLFFFLGVYCENRNKSDSVPVADFDIVRVELVGSVHTQSAI